MQKWREDLWMYDEDTHIMMDWRSTVVASSPVVSRDYVFEILCWFAAKTSRTAVMSRFATKKKYVQWLYVTS